MIIVDASVLIAHLNPNDSHHERAVSLLSEIATGPLGASSLTLAEVLVFPASNGTLDQAAAAIESLHVSTIPLDVNSHLRLALLRAGTKLRLPDCCVLLAAETMHADIATFDERLAHASTRYGHAVISA